MKSLLSDEPESSLDDGSVELCLPYFRRFFFLPRLFFFDDESDNIGYESGSSGMGPFPSFFVNSVVCFSGEVSEMVTCSFPFCDVEMVKSSFPFCDGEMVKCSFPFCYGEMVECSFPFCDVEMVKCSFPFCDGEMVKCSFPFCDVEMVKCSFPFCDGDLVKCSFTFCDGQMVSKFGGVVEIFHSQNSEFLP